MNRNRHHANRPTAHTMADRNRQHLAITTNAAAIASANRNATTRKWLARGLAVLAVAVLIATFI